MYALFQQYLQNPLIWYPCRKKVRNFFSLRIFPTVFVQIFEKVIWEHWVWRDQLMGMFQFKSKLHRKHYRMLVGFLTGHINLQYMLHKMRRAKTPSCRRCGAEKETSVHILCEYRLLEKARMQTLAFAGMDPEQIKKARPSGILSLGKGAGLLNSLLWI